MGRVTIKEQIGLAFIVMPCLLFSMDLTMLNLALPHIAGRLSIDGSQLLWVANISTLFLAATLIAVGKLSDRLGHRRLLLIGVGLFGVGALLAAFATSLPMLIAARALMGVAAATIAPSTLALINTLFSDPKKRITAVGVWAAALGIGGAIGPLLGGVVLQNFWWGAVFLINIPVVILMLIFGPVFLPASKPTKKEAIDFMGVCLLISALLPLIYAVQTIGGATPYWVHLLLVGSSAVLGYIFIRRQALIRHPLIDLSLFRSKQFRVALVIQFAVFFVNFPVFVFMSQYLQSVMEIPSLLAGVWLLPSGFGFIAGSAVSGWLVQRFKPIPTVVGGFIVSAIGFSLLAIMPYYGMVVMAIGLALYGLGLAPVIAISANLTLGSVSPAKAGLASGIGQSAVQLGGAFGIAVLGSIGTFMYAQGLRANTGQFAAISQDNVSGALQSARALPPTLSEEAIKIISQSFIQGLTIVCLISVVIVLAAAFFVARSGPKESKTSV